MGDRLNIVVAGGSSGIGAALSLELAMDGHLVCVCGRRVGRLRRVASRSENIRFGVCDVSEEGDVRRFAKWVRRQVSHVDVLVNCAGAFGALGKTWETASREWKKTIETNLFGTYLMIKHIVPLMEKSSRPRIINFSGGGAFNPFPHYSAYAASKAAVVRLTETLAVELELQKIAVNAVAPGFVATEIHQATVRAGARAGREHLAKTLRLLKDGGASVQVPVRCVKFLISADADGLTGKTLSAGFDPWDTQAFREGIPAINESDLYTLRRINLENLPEGPLKTKLVTASAQRAGLA